MTDMAINRGDLLFNNRPKQFGVVISKLSIDDYGPHKVTYLVTRVHWMDHRSNDSYIQNYYGDSLTNLVERNEISRY